MISVPGTSRVSPASGYGDTSVVDSNRPSSRDHPLATSGRSPSYNRATAARSYGPAAPKASSGDSASIFQVPGATRASGSGVVHTSYRPQRGCAGVNRRASAGAFRVQGAIGPEAPAAGASRAARPTAAALFV